MEQQSRETTMLGGNRRRLNRDDNGSGDKTSPQTKTGRRRRRKLITRLRAAGSHLSALAGAFVEFRQVSSLSISLSLDDKLLFNLLQERRRALLRKLIVVGWPTKDRTTDRASVARNGRQDNEAFVFVAWLRLKRIAAILVYTFYSNLLLVLTFFHLTRDLPNNPNPN